MGWYSVTFAWSIRVSSTSAIVKIWGSVGAFPPRRDLTQSFHNSCLGTSSSAVWYNRWSWWKFPTETQWRIIDLSFWLSASGARACRCFVPSIQLVLSPARSVEPNSCVQLVQILDERIERDIVCSFWNRRILNYVFVMCRSMCLLLSFPSLKNRDLKWKFVTRLMIVTGSVAALLFFFFFFL